MIPRRTPQRPSRLLVRCQALLESCRHARASLSSSSPIATAPTTTSTPPINHGLPGAVDFETDVLVIGAGVVGIAVARRAAQLGSAVVLLERNDSVGQETSSRNSEVIHAGLYYPPGSLKADLCARGRDMLYDYCASKNIAHKQIGKLVVATDDDDGGDAQRLAALARNAEQACARAGAKPLGLRLLSGDEARVLESSLGPRVSRALLSPRTGIVDSHGLMASLLADATEEGGGGQATTTLALRSEAVPMPGASKGGGAGGALLTVAVRSGDETVVFGAQRVVNCAGLGAEACAKGGGALAHLGPRVASSAPRLRYAKGNYFELAPGGARPPCSFSRLIYPLPVDGGLGIHLTLDMAGRARFGPDVEWLPHPVQRTTEAKADAKDAPASLSPPRSFDYRVAPSRASAAGWPAAIHAYWPALPEGSLVPAYSGVRPKLSGPGEPAEDFGVQTARRATWRGATGHGVDGLVCLYGVESPGLTSALALAEHVVVGCL